MPAPVTLRQPTKADGQAVFSLVTQCPPLDVNSMYCNLLQCTHFAQTSVVACQQNTLVGLISAYRVPERADTLFVWQVAVSEQARGQGLALHMLEHILNRDACAGVNHLETTVTQDNHASQALFTRLAASKGALLSRSVLFDRQQHFADQHDTEILLRIGPLLQQSRRLSSVS